MIATRGDGLRLQLSRDGGTCRQECKPTVAAALDAARGWVGGSID